MKTRKLTAILLALCMLLSLSISAFAADDAVVSGTIPDSKITWELDGKGWLTISGSGDCSAFTSKDDQPWAEYRGQITQVWFDGMESLAIPDLAYWFEDCTNLTTAEIPSTTPVIGRHAFYNCPLLTKLSIYYGEHTLDSIGEDAFWRETDNGDTLYVAYIIGYGGQFKEILDEQTFLKEKRSVILANNNEQAKANQRIMDAAQTLENASPYITEWDESAVRQLVETVKILSKDEVAVTLKGGIEICQKIMY